MTYPYTNPCYLKIDLFCRGMRIDPGCDLDNDARPVRRTRAGLGSGLEIVIQPDLYTNVPLEEKFVAGTPYSLHKEDGRYVIRRDGVLITAVTLPRRPQWYDQTTGSGQLMSRIAVMQGTYLAVYPGRICHFWTTQPRSSCHFCSTGLNVGTIEASEKSVRDVLETVLAARRENNITYVHFNTGYMQGGELEFLTPFVREVKQKTNLMVGVQTTPAPDLRQYDKLARLGVNNVSFCFELWDKDRLAEVCPGKSAEIGQDRYLEAIRYCRRLFPAVNGEIIAGLEPVEKTIEGIRWITRHGAQPTVCVFRPCVGTDYEHMPPPDADALVPVFREQYEACIRNGVPIGIAPNIRVSLVVLPEEGRYLAMDRSAAFKIKEFRNRAIKTVFRAYFHFQLSGKKGSG